MSIEQRPEKRLVTARKVLVHIDSMIANPGGKLWPARLNLMDEPITPEQGLNYIDAAVRVDSILGPLAIKTRVGVQRRVETLERQLVDEPMNVIRASAERRRQGLPGLSEEVLQRAERIRQELLLSGNEVRVESPVVALPVPEPVVIEVIVPVVRTEGEKGADINGIKKPEDEVVVIGSVSFTAAPEKSALAPTEFDSNKLKLTPKETQILQIVQENKGGVGRLEVARLASPGRTDADALNSLGYNLAQLRRKMREQGFSIADIGTAEDKGAVYDIVTIAREEELAESRSSIKGIRGGRSNKIRIAIVKGNQRSKEDREAPHSTETLINHPPLISQAPVTSEAGEKK